MASNELAKFCLEYLPTHPDLNAKIYAITDKRQFASALLDAGTKAGFAFTADEVGEALAAAAARGAELSDDQLEAVAGGAGAAKKKGDEKPLEYFKITLEDVLISSYR
jgi:predicted ribosomally synthesized peptide with nif11-like leader